MLLKFRASDNTQLNYLDLRARLVDLIIFQHGFSMDHQQVVDTWLNFRNIRLGLSRYSEVHGAKRAWTRIHSIIHSRGKLI